MAEVSQAASRPRPQAGAQTPGPSTSAAPTVPGSEFGALLTPHLEPPFADAAAKVLAAPVNDGPGGASSLDPVEFRRRANAELYKEMLLRVVTDGENRITGDKFINALTALELVDGVKCTGSRRSEILRIVDSLLERFPGGPDDPNFVKAIGEQLKATHAASFVKDRNGAFSQLKLISTKVQRDLSEVLSKLDAGGGEQRSMIENALKQLVELDRSMAPSAGGLDPEKVEQYPKQVEGILGSLRSSLDAKKLEPVLSGWLNRYDGNLKAYGVQFQLEYGEYKSKRFGDEVALVQKIVSLQRAASGFDLAKDPANLTKALRSYSNMLEVLGQLNPEAAVKMIPKTAEFEKTILGLGREFLEQRGILNDLPDSYRFSVQDWKERVPKGQTQVDLLNSYFTVIEKITHLDSELHSKLSSLYQALPAGAERDEKCKQDYVSAYQALADLKSELLKMSDALTVRSINMGTGQLPALSDSQKSAFWSVVAREQQKQKGDFERYNLQLSQKKGPGYVDYPVSYFITGGREVPSTQSGQNTAADTLAAEKLYSELVSLAQAPAGKANAGLLRLVSELDTISPQAAQSLAPDLQGLFVEQEQEGVRQVGAKAPKYDLVLGEFVQIRERIGAVLWNDLDGSPDGLRQQFGKYFAENKDHPDFVRDLKDPQRLTVAELRLAAFSRKFQHMFSEPAAESQQEETSPPGESGE